MVIWLRVLDLEWLKRRAKEMRREFGWVTLSR